MAEDKEMRCAIRRQGDRARRKAQSTQEKQDCLRQPSANQQRRLAAETAWEREERLRQLSDNQQCRLATEEREAYETTL